VAETPHGPESKGREGALALQQKIKSGFPGRCGHFFGQERTSLFILWNQSANKANAPPILLLV
jgi:hypothetical protein